MHDRGYGLSGPFKPTFHATYTVPRLSRPGDRKSCSTWQSYCCKGHGERICASSLRRIELPPPIELSNLEIEVQTEPVNDLAVIGQKWMLASFNEQ